MVMEPRPSRRLVALGFVVALALLAGLVAVVGVEAFLSVLASANPYVALAALGASVGWLVAWGLSLRAVCASLDVSLSRPRAVLVYGSVAFANSVAPFAQVGTEPVAAYVLSRSARTDYETALAAVVGVDVLNFLPSTAFAAVGLLYFTTTAVLLGHLRTAALTLLAVAGLIVLVGGALWRFRAAVGARVRGVALSAAALGGRVVPGWTPPPPAVFERRVERFVGQLERLADDPRRLGIGLAYSAAGWLLLSVAFWLSLTAVGAPNPLVAPLFVVPLSMLAVLIPLPGGVGSVDAALVLLTVAATGATPATATAATLVYRGVTYWFVLVAGGGVTAVLQASATRPAAPRDP